MFPFFFFPFYADISFSSFMVLSFSLNTASSTFFLSSFGTTYNKILYLYSFSKLMCIPGQRNCWPRNGCNGVLLFKYCRGVTESILRMIFANQCIYFFKLLYHSPIIPIPISPCIYISFYHFIKGLFPTPIKLVSIRLFPYQPYHTTLTKLSFSLS
ncbi:hypothetical protein QOT17_019014 [Balamuthia mandrillaris]